MPVPNGGKRKGAGRKTIAAEIAQYRIETEGDEEAQYAFSLFVNKMHGGRISVSRLAAARVVMDRVLGQPKQTIANTGEIPIKWTVDYRKELDEPGDDSATTEA